MFANGSTSPEYESVIVPFMRVWEKVCEQYNSRDINIILLYFINIFPDDLDKNLSNAVILCKIARSKFKKRFKGNICEYYEK